MAKTILAQKRNQTKKTILVIEDEKPLLEVIRQRIKKEGFEVKTARTAQEGINYLKSSLPLDLIWLDHYLPGKDTGLDFVWKIHQNERWRKIPVFVISNSTSHDKQRSYIQLGVVKYYTKADYRLGEIIEDICQFLKAKKNE